MYKVFRFNLFQSTVKNLVILSKHGQQVNSSAWLNRTWITICRVKSNSARMRFLSKRVWVFPKANMQRHDSRAIFPHEYKFNFDTTFPRKWIEESYAIPKMYWFYQCHGGGLNILIKNSRHEIETRAMKSFFIQRQCKITRYVILDETKKWTVDSLKSIIE